MSDFSKNQPKPQSRPSTGREADDQGGAPATGFNDAPRVGLPATGPGAGTPPNSRKIH